MAGWVYGGGWGCHCRRGGKRADWSVLLTRDPVTHDIVVEWGGGGVGGVGGYYWKSGIGRAVNVCASGWKED